MPMKPIMVLGSANMDLVVRAPRFPADGESLIGSGFGMYPGGKGANQAAAIGRLGGRPKFAAKVGCDSFGQELLHALGASGVDTGLVVMDPAYSTGVALITVADGGRNTIVTSPGANGQVTAEDAAGAVEEVRPFVFLAQLEVPMEAVAAAAGALASDALFVLNPAPAAEIPAEILSRVDYLTPNEVETQALTGIYPDTAEACEEAARRLLNLGVRNVVLTLGEQGSHMANSLFSQDFPALPVQAVDTTAAGDAFNGALAYFLAAGREIGDAVSFANVAGALSTLKPGAIPSLPTLREVMSAG
jgi:ribokinase